MLTDTRARNSKPKEKTYRLADSGGLCLEVRPTGAKFWRYRYRIDEKEHMFALGEYPDISLAQARKERDTARALVKRGRHPIDARKAERVAQALEDRNTFQAVAEEWISKHKSKWSDYYAGQVETILGDDVFPIVGILPIKEVSAAHLLGIIQDVEGRGAPTIAILIRQWCSAIFRYAAGTLRADHDPAAVLKGAITRPKVRHRRPLERNDIPKLLKQLDEYGGYRETAIALRLLLLTFVRPVEMRGAEWAEFDLDRAEWRIPAERMKMDNPHIVPLSHQTLVLLHELKALTGGERFLFPNQRRPKDHMSATTLNRALERLGYGGQFSAHGFRATASTNLNEMGFKSDWIERQLAHGPKDMVRASYNFAEYLDDRRAMMQTWADHIDALASGAKVLPFKRVR